MVGNGTRSNAAEGRTREGEIIFRDYYDSGDKKSQKG